MLKNVITVIALGIIVWYIVTPEKNISAENIADSFSDAQNFRSRKKGTVYAAMVLIILDLFTPDKKEPTQPPPPKPLAEKPQFTYPTPIDINHYPINLNNPIFNVGVPKSGELTPSPTFR